MADAHRRGHVLSAANDPAAGRTGKNETILRALCCAARVHTNGCTNNTGFLRSRWQKPVVRLSGVADSYKTSESGYVPVVVDRDMLHVVGYLDDYPKGAAAYPVAALTV
ncbi:hypothetical protein EDB86DRAFT_2829132 [Lactarius hatsudake]|nr:hypothetical protein EDB86DRAFT_2829132 [Lactarius hatsudake]